MEQKAHIDPDDVDERFNNYREEVLEEMYEDTMDDLIQSMLYYDETTHAIYTGDDLPSLAWGVLVGESRATYLLKVYCPRWSEGRHVQVSGSEVVWCHAP